MKVGEWIRFGKGNDVKIDKIIEKGHGEVNLEKDRWWLMKDIPVKSTSENIIDLIEVGDLVNKVVVSTIEEIQEDYKNDVVITDIVTHEQYDKIKTVVD